MSTYMQYRAPNNTFHPTQLTRTLIRTLRNYIYSQWTDQNNTVDMATLTASRATHRLSLKTQIKEAYQNNATIPIDKWSITFGVPLTLQLEQTTANMEAWLLQYQAGQTYNPRALQARHHYKMFHILHPRLPFRQTTRLDKQIPPIPQWYSS